MNIADILRDLDIPFCRAGEHHHVREGWIGVDCPHCPSPRGDKGKYRLGIELSSGRANCWVCGRQNLAAILVEMGRVSFSVAKELLKGANLKRLHVDQRTKKTAGKVTRPKGVGPMAEPHKRYLRERGFDPSNIEKLWKVEGIGISSELQWRLFIPIAFNGAEVSWTTRSISHESRMRYVSATPEQEKVHLKDIMYGIDLTRTAVILVEGPADAWRVGPGACALFGLNYTPSQIDIIKRFQWRVVCFDNAPDAQRRATQLCSSLQLLPGKTTNICLDAEDPGSASEKEIKQLRRLVFGE